MVRRLWIIWIYCTLLACVVFLVMNFPKYKSGIYEEVQEIVVLSQYTSSSVSGDSSFFLGSGSGRIGSEFKEYYSIFVKGEHGLIKRHYDSEMVYIREDDSVTPNIKTVFEARSFVQKDGTLRHDKVKVLRYEVVVPSGSIIDVFEIF